MLLGHAHICEPWIIFCEVEKDGDGRCQTIKENFSYFVKKIKDEKVGKLLKMFLDPYRYYWCIVLFLPHCFSVSLRPYPRPRKKMKRDKIGWWCPSRSKYPQSPHNVHWLVVAWSNLAAVGYDNMFMIQVFCCEGLVAGHGRLGWDCWLTRLTHLGFVFFLKSKLLKTVGQRQQITCIPF